MRIGAVVQARMGSRRLPGKVLRKLGGVPLLQYLLERLDHCRELDLVGVATSRRERDRPIWELCRSLGVPCLRGPEADVAGRFGLALTRWGLGAVVRVCADSPLLDPALVDEGVRRFRDARGRGVNLVSNVVSPRGGRPSPPGQAVEIISRRLLRRALARMVLAYHREHVTTYLYQHRRDPALGVRLLCLACPGPWRGVEFTVDTAGDLERLRRLAAAMAAGRRHYGLEEMTELYRELGL